ncbi:hypothetical protein [Streptosporangium sp. NPDC087985]|uniref:hypothetical protein n=1 Tax=Streptosporangium sp. NPDC087985 TaxID=3366196 RepID=UPI0038284E17
MGSATAVLDRYRDLLRDQEWLGGAICWTVIVPDGERPSLEEVAARVAGVATGFEASVNPRELPHREQQSLVAVGYAGRAVVLFEHNGFLGSLDLVLRRLSTDSRVYSAYWDIEGNNRVSHAAAGEVVVALDAMEPEEWGSEDYLRRWPELEIVLEAVLADEEDWQAAALAAVELATGVGLDATWLDDRHPYFGVPWPAPTSVAPIETDGGPESHDLLMRLANTLVDRFALAEFPITREVVTALAVGTPVADHLIVRLREDLVSPIAADYMRHESEGDPQQNPYWRRMQAALALSLAAEGPGARPLGIDAFYHAELALPGEWPSTRDDSDGDR